MNSPFVQASSRNKRVKLFLWGPPSCYKTRLSLQFPAPAVIDLEGGTDHYGDEFDFDVMPNCTSVDRIREAVKWLMTNDHEYRTLVIDPITVWWDMLQSQWAEILGEVRGGQAPGSHNTFYELQPGDWKLIKGDNKELMRWLSDIDMNVIVTAHQKTQYKDNSFMVPAGVTFDGEKKLEYFFDTTLQLMRNSEGRVTAICHKDRSNRIKEKNEFPVTYEALAEMFGEKELHRKAKPVDYASPEQVMNIQQLQSELQISDAKLKKVLAEYGVEKTGHLTSDAAETILDRMETKKKELANAAS